MRQYPQFYHKYKITLSIKSVNLCLADLKLLDTATKIMCVLVFIINSSFELEFPTLQLGAKLCLQNSIYT